MYQGIILPFRDDPESNLIVRVVYNETKIFITRERCPFLVLFETISKDDLSSIEPEWEKDLDFLRWHYNLIDKGSKDLNDVKEDMRTAKLRESKNFENLKTFLAKENEILKNKKVGE